MIVVRPLRTSGLWSLLSAVGGLAGCFGLDTVPTKDETTSADDTATIAIGALAVDRSTLDFGAVAVGSAATEAVVLSNLSEDTLRVAARLSGDAVFELSDADIALAPGGDSTLSVTFVPTGDMAYGGTVGLALEDGTSLDVTLVGTGGDVGDTGSSGGALEITPGSKDFGSVDLGGASTFDFTVANRGSEDVVVESVAATNAAFTVTGGTLSTPQVISAGASKTVRVAFSPSAAVDYTGQLVLQTDLSPSEVSASLSGSGNDSCTGCAPRIRVDTGGDAYSVTDFFSFLGAEDSRTWTIENTGDADLIVSSVTVNNDSISTCGEFAISRFTGPKTVAPSASTTFSISYAVTSNCADLPQGAFDANVVHVLSNDRSESDYVIEVGGLGVM
jgi:hypothetical protein